MIFDATRRKALQRLVGVAALPVVGSFAACRRKSANGGDDSPAGDDAAVEPTNLDEVENAARFRPPLPASEPLIRVRVLRIREPGKVVQLGSPDQWLQVRRETSENRGVALAGPLEIRMTDDGWSVTDGNGFRAALDGFETVMITSSDDPSASLGLLELETDPSATPPLQRRSYQGTLRLVARPDLAPRSSDQASHPANASRLIPDCPYDIINDVGLESYLPGVLAGELYRHWHLETFAAQAVAARSFAATEAAVFAGRRHYDVTNTASSQMYIGTVEHKKSLQAVAMTRGLVLAYENLLVSGYYSSCCGGAAASAVEVIGANPVNDVRPLEGRSGSDVCMDAPVYKWTVEQPIDALTARFAAWGAERRNKMLAGFTRISAIELLYANENGRPIRYKLTDEAGATAELTAENLRRAASHTGPKLPPLDKPLRSSFLQATFTAEKVIFEGYGFGHGVGLCQYGAETLAKAGRNHREILVWYYPEVELAQAYL